MMIVHRSNRMEKLVGALHTIVARPLQDPLAPEIIVVEGRGIERWLERELADLHGIWAHAEFPFPRRFLHDVFSAVLDEDAAADDPYDPDALAWAIAGTLPELVERSSFAPVRDYLDVAADPTTLLSLSRRIATLFDQYVVYRPDWIAAWERGHEDHWQADLWRELVDRCGQSHFAARAAAFHRRLASVPSHGLPERVSVFGIATLAPAYLDCLSALSAHSEVHLFQMAPSNEYWGDVRNQAQVLRERRQRSRSEVPLEDEVIAAAGHPLLASLGAVGRDFQAVLESRCAYRDLDLSEEKPARDTLLSQLQADILTLDDPRRLARPRRVHADGSIEVHACHGPLREVQVLHDRLRDQFEDVPDLQPHEVVVLCPDIDTYAPWIEAVFGTAEDDAAWSLRRIPFHLADRRVRSSDAVVDAFLRVLATFDGRMTATEVADLLDVEPVRVRFGLGEADAATLRAWIRDSGIRWGADAGHRGECGQPAVDANTWRFGLDRLFLGFAMGDGDETPVAERMPLDVGSSAAPALLGAFAELCDILCRWRAETRAPRTVPAWRDTLQLVLDELVGEDRATHDQRQAIRDALAALAGETERAGFTTPLPLEPVRRLLEERLERAAPGRNFVSGSVTFAALLPMRSVPFRVVCLLGMNEDQFPRRERRAGFDRMASRPRPGDRSVREDDRYLFLEALLAARDRLLVTYVGASLHGDEKVPPSAVVSELLDVLDATFAIGEEGRSAAAELLLEHPLQPFDARYFDGDDPRLFSYDERALGDAHILQRPRPTLEPVFCPAALPPAPERTPAVTIERLARFLRNPAQAFLRNRLGLYAGDDDESLEDREPITLQPRDAWDVGDALVHGAEPSEALFRARGALPPGTLGSVAFDEIEASAGRIRSELERRVGPAPLPPHAVELDVAGTTLGGVLTDLWPAGIVLAQYGKLRERQLLELWVRHLVLCRATPPGSMPASTLLARSLTGTGVTARRFRTVAETELILADLLQLYALGHERPLPLLPAASYAYAATYDDRGEVAAWQAACRAIRDGTAVAGEASDASITLAFGNDVERALRASADAAEPAARFGDLARRVFAPLLAHLEEIDAEAAP